MKHKKSALFKSLISLLLCFSMLIGTTFAWFTDSVTTGINTIAAGNLDVELFHSNAAVSNERVDSCTKLFMDLQGDPILWEPGVVSYENLRVTNAGDLALAYQLAINTANENFVVDASGAKYGLSQVLKVGVVEGGITATDRAGVVASVEAANWTTLDGFLRSGSLFPEGEGESEKTWGVVIYWEPGENDNLWNLNNGKQLSEGDVLTIDLGIRLIATQEQYENDSFGSDYDETAKKDVFPEFEGGSASVTVAPNDQNQTAVDVVMTSGGVKAFVPAGVQLADGTTQLVMTVSVMTESGANVVLGKTEAMRSLDVHIEGISPDNTVPITVTLEEVAPVGLNMGNYKLYHVENGTTVEMTLVDTAADFTSHNQFKYDPATGDIVLYMATFSEVAVVADTTKAWNGGVDHSWYEGKQSPYSIANADQLWSFSQIVGGMAEGIAQDSFNGKSVLLISDVNINDGEESNDPDKIFYPIGYNCSDDSYVKTGVKVTTGFYPFEGTFDGQGHSVSNIYQNTWEMKGDNEYYSAAEQYYRDGMGLFGKVYGGTVKNLTVKNFKSDGEYTTTGVIAAYADSKTDKSAIFENIAIVDCNPRVYNIGNGGIVGCGGWYSKDTTTSKPITFKNITVDKTNKISALWGSYDVACGGIMGQYYPNSGCGVYFENCNMAAQMDVYNDVCGNYQYYAYRYAGMMIGSIRNNLPADENGHVYPDMTGIKATNCTVNFGDWNDYYYCEFVKNGHPSYSGETDYKFSRVPNNEIDVSNGKENATCIGHNHTDVEDNQAVYLPFTQLFTGYGWGVTSKGLTDFDGVTIEIKESEQNESVTKFATRFTGNFLYRVGNLNEIKIGNLFAAINENVEINDSGVYVRIDKVYEDADVTCTFTPAGEGKAWTDGALRFNGTGVVEISIQDYDYCVPTTLMLEVVDAVNATSAASAKSNNVVLLNDVGLHTIEVSNGYTLYGNGFKMTATSDVMYDAMGVGFVTLKNGTLDNVQIICPNFSYAIVYTSQIKNAENTAVPSDTSSDARGNVRSAVLADGNSTIVNSYIHGGRAAVFFRSGNLLIENSTISGGAAANIHTVSAQSLTLRNATLIQKPFQATVHDTSKTVMGFSGLFECGEDGNSTPLILEGTLVQKAWINEDYTEYVPSAASSIVNTALDKTEYLHDLNSDGTKESLNLGFAYIPQGTGGSTRANVTDNRENKNTVPYDAVDVGNALASATVYSYKNSQGTSDDYVVGEEIYVPGVQGATPPTVTFTDANVDRVFETKFDTNDNRWESTLTVNLDSGDYIFSFDHLLMQKYGTNLSYSVKTVDGIEVDTTVTINLNASSVTEYVLTVADDGAKHTIHFILIATKTSIPEPVKVADPNGTHYLVVKSKDGDWSCAINALEGAKIEYHDASGNKQTLDLSSLITSTDTGKLNGTNNSWTKTQNGYTLKVTCGYIHDTKQIYGMPVAVNGKLYFTISSTNGYVSTSTSGRTVTLTYEFTDPNGKTLTFSKTTQFNYADYKSGNQYKYDDFVKGTLTEATGGDCVTGDTLVTLADGTQKRIDHLTYQDELLVWDFYNGCYATTTASVIFNHGDGIHKVTNLNFSDGTSVGVIGGHEFFDADANAFVYITEQNVAEYVGHRFVKTDGSGYSYVVLQSYNYTEEEIGNYTILTAQYNNAIVEGMLSLTPDPTHKCEDFFRLYEVGEDMKYDQKKMQADIEKYGLFAYEDLALYVTYEEFVAFNGEFYKILVGKGLITVEDIVMALATYAPNH